VLNLFIGKISIDLVSCQFYKDFIKQEKLCSLQISVGYLTTSTIVLNTNTRLHGADAIIINPNGNSHDGMFEIVIMTMNYWSCVINLGLSAFDKRALNVLEDYSEILKVKSAKVSFDELILLQLDGEVVGDCKLIKAEIQPETVQLISAGDNHFNN
jgi:diacylglycerol kinase family enzyme